MNPDGNVCYRAPIGWLLIGIGEKSEFLTLSAIKREPHDDYTTAPHSI
jgi:hypothetical protein